MKNIVLTAENSTKLATFNQEQFLSQDMHIEFETPKGYMTEEFIGSTKVVIDWNRRGEETINGETKLKSILVIVLDVKEVWMPAKAFAGCTIFSNGVDGIQYNFSFTQWGRDLFKSKFGADQLEAIKQIAIERANIYK